MTIQAEVSLYPLRTGEIGAPIEGFVEALKSKGLDIKMGPMSTSVIGDSSKVFAALGESFASVARRYQAVLIVKASNACPAGKNPQQE
jgi:uncharacterized protein YqgV (UPF0045/DUF77 family)